MDPSEAAVEVESMVVRWLRDAPRSVPKDHRDELAATGRAWEDLWPQNRRLFLRDTFTTITWNSKRRRLIVGLANSAADEGERESRR